MSYVYPAVLGAVLMVAVWSVVIERRLLHVRRIVLDCDELGLPPLKILHVTDTHFHGRDARILGFLRRVSSRERFDLVLFTGDLLDKAGGLESVGQIARMFRPVLGGFAVLGGHDYKDYSGLRPYSALLFRKGPGPSAPPNPVSEVVRRLEDGGVRVLRDEHAEVATPGGRRFAIVGLRDAYAVKPDCEAAWRGVAGDVPVLAIAHSPDVLREVCARGAALAFFGHTHGGQVRLPFLGALVTHTKVPRSLAVGLFACERTVFVVSSGVGTAPSTPFRLLCPPEVVVVELRHSPREGEASPVREVNLD